MLKWSSVVLFYCLKVGLMFTMERKMLLLLNVLYSMYFKYTVMKARNLKKNQIRS